MHVRVVAPIGEFLRYGDGIGAVAFGGKTRPARIKLGEALGDDRQIGARHRLVKADKNVARFDVIALAHANLTNDAAGRMLHFLDVGIDDQGTLRDQRAGNLGRRRPAAKSDGKKRHDHTSHDDVPVD